MVPCFVSYRGAGDRSCCRADFHAGEAIDTDNAETRTRKTGGADDEAPSFNSEAGARPAASTAKPTAPATPAATAVKYGPGVYAHFTTNQGSFIVRLFDKDAPITVQNFIGLAEGKKAWTDPRTNRSVRRPYYNNLTFHRIIPNFMIQGGDPTGTGFSGPGFKFNDEISPKLKHDRPGILSMANSGPNTNGGQFFITVAPYPSLDGKYSIFGEVVEGLDRVVAISKVPTSGPKGDPPNKPLSPVVMKSVRIERVS